MTPRIIIGSDTIMEQPDMIDRIPNYHSTFITDPQFSQIYAFQVSGSASVCSTALPDASVDFVFYRSADGRRGLRLIGPAHALTSSYVDFTGDTEYFGVRLKPALPAYVQSASTRELYGAILELDAADAAPLIDRLFAADSLPAQLEIAQPLLARTLRGEDSGKTAIVRYIMARLLQRRDVRVADLATDMGYSPYYINKMFHDYTGFRIAQYRRLLRLHSVLNAYEPTRNTAQMPTQAELALSLGFSDQAHMIREFRCFTGMTPREYWRTYYKAD